MLHQAPTTTNTKNTTMALDPLKFAIEIEKQNLKSMLAQARKDIESGLKDVPITLKIDNLNAIKEQLGNLEIKIKGIDSGGGSFKKEAEDLNKLKNTVAEFEKELSGSGGGISKHLLKNVETVDVAIKRLNNSMEMMQQKKSLAADFGANTTNLDEQIRKTKEYIDRLTELRGQTDKLSKKGVLTTPEKLGEFAPVWKGFSLQLQENQKFSSQVDAFAANVQRLNVAAENLTNIKARIEKEGMRSLSIGGETIKADKATAQINAFIQKLSSTNPGDANAVRSIIAEYSVLTKTLGAALEAQKSYNNEKEKANNKADAKLQKEADQAMRAADEYTKLALKIREYNDLVNKARGKGIDTAGMEKAIQNLEQQLHKLRSVATGSERTTNLSRYMAGVGQDKAIGRDEARRLKETIRELEKEERKEAQAAREAERAQQAAERARQRAAQATRKLSDEEQRLSQSIQQTVQKMHGHSQVLNDLKSMAAQYLSVYAGQQFLNNIIEIGGQLEMQRLSIGAILQDVAHANDLFDKIKGLALQSPFGVVELDQFTKQLSAYGFKYNELFDMTKRLADISAGAGTDVSRLALALGHVRAEGALTGYTLRQFAMNNIPMLGKLSEKLSEIEGRIVTAGEVRKRVREKEIDYSMVEGVIKDLTNEGGMFYNMQEVVSGSVKAKWKNLRDAFDVMYGEMAESAVGGALKGVATMLTELAKQWKTLGTAIMAVAAAFGYFKVWMLLYNTLLGKNTAAVFAGIAAERNAELSKLRLAKAYRTLTTEEQISLTLGKGLRMSDLQTAISAKTLTTEQLAKGVAMGKVSKATALAAIANSALTAEEKALMTATVNNVRTFGRYTGAINGFRIAVSQLGMALKTIFLNPMTWIMAAISGITYLWQKNNEEVERAAELSKNIAQKSAEGLKNIRSMMTETGITYTKGGKNYTGQFGEVTGGTLNVTPSASLDEDAMIQTMEKWEDFLKNYGASPNKMLKDAFWDEEGNVRTLEEQYNRLAKSVNLVSNAYLELGKFSDIAESALDSTNKGWLDDDLVKNINDYAKSTKKYQNALMGIAAQHPKLLTSGLQAARGNEAFAKALEEANKQMLEKSGRNMTEVEQLDMLIRNQEKYSDAMKAFNSIAPLGNHDPGTIYNYSVTSDSEKLDEDIKAFAKQYRSNIEQTFGKSIEALGEPQKEAARMSLQAMVAQASVASEEIRKEMVDRLSKEIGIPLDINEVETLHRIGLVEQELNKLMEGPDGKGEWTIDIKGAVNGNDIVQKVREGYKKAKDTVENLKPIAIKMGVSLDGIKNLSDDQIRKLAGDSILKRMFLTSLRDAFKDIESAEKSANTYGFSLSDPNSGGKTFRDKKSKSSTGSKEDKEAKKLREKVRILKEAASSFQYWRKMVGQDSSFSHVNEEFGKLLSEEGFKVEDVDKLRQTLAALRAEYEKKPRTKAMMEALRELDKTIAELDRKDFEKATEKALSSMERELDNLTDKWSTFNSVREATGDKGLAAQLAGLDDFARDNYRNAADELVGAISDKLFEDNVGGIVDFDKVLGMSEDDIEEYVKSLYGGMSGYEKNIKAIIRALKEWQKLEKDVIKDDINTYAKLIGSMTSYGAQLKKNNDEFERNKNGLKAQLDNGEITQSQYEEALRIAQTQRDTKNWKLSSTYLNLMNGSNALVRGEVLDVVDRAVESLKEQMEAGLITTQEYAEELAKLKKIQADWDDNALFGKNNAMTNFIQKGLPGLKQFLETARDNAERNGDEKTVEKLDKQIKTIDTVANTLGDLAVVVDLVIGALDGMQKAATALSNVFDALGHTGSANTWSDISDGIGAVSSFFTPANGVIQSAMSGNIGGLVSSAISAPFQMIASPIEGFAKLHDKRRERQIENIRKDIQKIDNTLNLIRTTRGKTLGYDNGAYRRMMAAMYANDKSGSGKAMYEYYSRGGLDISGYQQELDSLKKQREEYAKMYDKEKSKKKESKEALEEYKQKMAELDMQIKDYSIELANELWSIDLKGWADQIGDALMNAFENGTSAAIAFQDATRSIMQSVVSEMLKVGFMQPMLERLKERLFGADGAFDPMNPEKSMGAVLSELGRFFGEGGEGSKMIGAAGEFLSGAEELLNKNFGMSLKNNSSSSTQTNGIQSQATEESIGIVSGQLARIAQDVSVKRIFVTQLVTEQMPSISSKMDIQQTVMENQLQSVRAIERMMSDGTGAMYEAVYRMSQKIDRAITPEGMVRVQ